MGSFTLRRNIVPDRRKRIDLFVANQHPSSDAKWAIDRKDFAGWLGYEFRLEPSVHGTPAGMDLPKQIRGQPTNVANLNIDHRQITNRAMHRSACRWSLPGRNFCETIHIVVFLR